MNEEKSITKEEQCETCRFDFDRYCANKGMTCKNCERFSYDELKSCRPKETGTHCQCVSVEPGEPCPYYERA